MFRSILAATLSLALALPAATTPARADVDAEDVAKVLGGLAALYVLSRTLDNRTTRRNERVVAPVRRAPIYGQPTYTQPIRRAPVHSARPILRQDRHHRRDDRFHRDVRLLPDQCYREVDTRRGIVAGYGARCMQNRVARPGLLPPGCIVQVRTDRGTRNLYEPRCLRQAGWSPRTARR
ncbi:MAG: hypothetical protein AAF390_17545 [Pseudomonadota bacterium]